MKKSLLVTVLVLLFATSLEAKREEGVIITINETINAELIIPYHLLEKQPNYKAMQRGIRYVDNEGKKRRVKPSDVIRFEFDSNGKSYKMVSMRGKEGAGMVLGLRKNFFALELVSGNVKLYKMVYEDKNFSSDSFTTDHERYILERDGILKVPHAINFRNEMVAYFAEYPALVEKIQSKEYRYSDLEKIVNDYNRWLVEQ